MDFPNNFPPIDSQPRRLQDRLWSNPARNVRALLFAPLVFLGLALSTPGVRAQTGNRANASLRVTVNVVPAIQAGLSPQRDMSALARTMPAGDVLLLWPERWTPLTSIEEVRKLSESAWDSAHTAPSVFSAETHAAGDGGPVMAFCSRSGNQGDASAPAQGIVEGSDALVVTQTVVPE
jgi:hypothetical protein